MWVIDIAEAVVPVHRGPMFGSASDIPDVLEGGDGGDGAGEKANPENNRVCTININ